MNLKSTLGLGVIVLLISPTAGNSTPIAATLSDNVIGIDPPEIIRPGTLPNAFEAQLWVERQNFILPEDLPVDVVDPGWYTSRGFGSLPLFSIFANTAVDSYYLWHESDMEIGSTRIEADLKFDSEILGLIFEAETFVASDDLVGALGYFGTGLEPFDPSNPDLNMGISDFLVFGDDRRSMSISFANGPGSDAIRVITATVPEPGTLALFGIGLACIALARRRVHPIRQHKWTGNC